MRIQSRTTTASCAFAVLALAATSAMAQSYPVKPIRWVVPLPSGGGMDIMTRAVTTRLQPALGQSIVVDNRPGAAGAIGAESVARAAPDGYTLLSADNGIMTMNPFTYKKLPYDPMKDFLPVSNFARVPFLLVVNPALLPVKDAREFISHVRANPGKVNFGSFGAGSIAHIWMELLAQRMNLTMVHVPYKGAAPALQDLAGGQLPTMLVDFGAARGFITSGKLQALAVTTRVPHPRVPNAPTLESVGVKDYDIYGWVALFATAGTPRAIIDRLNAEMVKAAPEVGAQFADLGIGFVTTTPEELSAMVRNDMDRWGPVIRRMNLNLD